MQKMGLSKEELNVMGNFVQVMKYIEANLPEELWPCWMNDGNCCKEKCVVLDILDCLLKKKASSKSAGQI